MPEPNVRQVKVTTEDIDAVSQKLEAFARDLPPGEQNVLQWLLGRAASAGEEQVDFAAKGAADPELAAAEPKLAADQPRLAVERPGFRTQLNESLGIPQFERLNPGAALAGSSIGVTGTVMF